MEKVAFEPRPEEGEEISQVDGYLEHTGQME